MTDNWPPLAVLVTYHATQQEREQLARDLHVIASEFEKGEHGTPGVIILGRVGHEEPPQAGQ